MPAYMQAFSKLKPSARLPQMDSMRSGAITEGRPKLRNEIARPFAPRWLGAAAREARRLVGRLAARFFFDEGLVLADLDAARLADPFFADLDDFVLVVAEGING